MPDPNKRRLSLILLAAAALLLVAILLGKRMGDRVIVKATEQGQTGVGSSLTFTPVPGATEPAPFGPNWKRSQVLAAAPDPNFPDPRVPPVPLPTPLPTPKETPPPKYTATPRPIATNPGLETPSPRPTSPYYLHGPSITPAPLHPTPQVTGDGAKTPGKTPGPQPSPGDGPSPAPP